MSWQDDAMIEQDEANALYCMGEAEWRDYIDNEKQIQYNNHEAGVAHPCLPQP